MKYCLLILFLVAFSCYANIYSTQDSHGNITYSDIPTSNSKTVFVQPNTGIVTDQANVPPESNQEIIKIAKVKQIHYETFKIISPQDQETIQNQPVIPVELVVYPRLQPQNRIQLLVDGMPVGDAVNSTHLEVSILERGTHSLEAAIIDENNVVLQRSNRITIFVHRNSVLTSPATV